MDRITRFNIALHTIYKKLKCNKLKHEKKQNDLRTATILAKNYGQLSSVNSLP